LKKREGDNSQERKLQRGGEIEVQLSRRKRRGYNHWKRGRGPGGVTRSKKTKRRNPVRNQFSEKEKRKKGVTRRGKKVPLLRRLCQGEGGGGVSSPRSYPQRRR